MLGGLRRRENTSRDSDDEALALPFPEVMRHEDARRILFGHREQIRDAKHGCRDSPVQRSEDKRDR